MKKIIYILFPLLLFSTSCDPIKRHNRLVERYPFVHEAVIQKIHDTTIVHVPNIKHDTIVISKPKDTIIIEKDRLRIKIMKELDTLYIEGECMADTIIVTKTITSTLYTSKNQNKNENWILILIFIVLFLLFYFLIKKRK